MSGGDSQVVTPVPMPNTEVKHLNAESSWGLPPVRIGRCQALDRSADCRSVFLCVVPKEIEKLTSERQSVIKSVLRQASRLKRRCCVKKARLDLT